MADDDRLRLDLTASPPRLALAGGWTQGQGMPDATEVVARLPAGSDLAVDGAGIERWDTSLAAFVRTLDAQVRAGGGMLRPVALPAGLERLLRLLRPDVAPAAPAAGKRGTLAHRVGMAVSRAGRRAQAWAELAGRIVIAFLRLLTGRVRVPARDFVEQLVECGPRALPIVTMLSFLIGAITAFVGVVQLRVFNAELYVADLVGLGMLLELGALMTGVIMAGRAGAAFAAALGTMQTNEEIDALATLGLDPVEFLVLPRVLALLLCTPLLTLYADLMGILGGVFVGVTMLDIAPASFLTEMSTAVHLSDGVKGLIKGLAYGLLIGYAGCLRGIECGRSALAVGRATTSAVVTSIVLIVLADAGLTVLFFVHDGQI